MILQDFYVNGNRSTLTTGGAPYGGGNTVIVNNTFVIPPVGNHTQSHRVLSMGFHLDFDFLDGNPGVP